MTWWIYQNSRLNSEKAAIADLESGVDWLHVGKWQANSNLEMYLNFSISHGDKEFPFKMLYPNVFPDAPPMVYSEDEVRISQHQYGASGELCLEYRPDNWDPSITGADMVASCHQLLLEEQPNPGESAVARSAHVGSIGRDLRSKVFRFLITGADVAALNALEALAPNALKLNERRLTSTFLSSINYIGAEDAPFWTSDLVFPKKFLQDSGFVLRTPGVGKQGDINVQELVAHLNNMGLNEFADNLMASTSWDYLLIGDQHQWELYAIYGDADNRNLIYYTTVEIPADRQRLPDSFARLADKKVGIVGSGSVGSKIAASLCRAGVRGFLLIDDDIFFPGNVARNELDQLDVGAHKCVALQDRLLKLNPLCEIKVLRMAIGGQESAKSMVSAYDALGCCDLIVDATADPAAFNLIASVSTRKKKPMVWGKVYAGGIGGLIARARPEIDPVPLSAMRQIEVWYNDQGVEWARAVDAGRYEAQGDDGPPLIAGDAEVALVASHVTRFAIDILVQPDASIFPESAYVVGFTSEWLFNEPFHTRPIQLQPDGHWGEIVDVLEPEEALRILEEHLDLKGGLG